MERDFMGIGGSDSGGCGGREDSAFSIVQRGLSNKQSCTQQFIPFKNQQEEKPTNAFFDPISSKTSAVQGPQISFGVNGHNVQQFDIHNYHNQEVDNNRSYAHLAPVLPISMPIFTSSPLFKIHGASNGANVTVGDVKIPSFGSNKSSLQGAGVGFFTPRNAMISPPTTAQLTIFYAGSVHVYDDVPWDKAQAIMLKAGGCKATTNVAHSIVESPALLLTKGPISEGLKVAQTPKIIHSHVVSSCSGLSSSLSLASSKGNQSESGSMTTDDKVGATKIGTLASTSQDETSMTMNNSMVSATVATIMPRAVPQARKASIARFLEKRKERVSNKVPYSFDKTPPETVPDVAVPFSNCSAPEVSLSNKQDFSWFKGHAQNSDDKTNSPNTKLEM